MSGFLSKLSLKPANRILAPVSREKTHWIDENDPRILYYLRPRARRISIKMDAAKREIGVTVPGHERQLASARRFVDKKWDWIQVQLETLPPPQPFVDGGEILFQGELFQLTCPGARGRAKIDEENRRIIVPAPEGTLEGRTKRFLIRQAREALSDSTEYYAGRLDRAVDSISVRDTSSRWGSCVKGRGAQGGKISYSWRLVCAPPFVLDYVAAHECAHLIEANHGAGFWALVDDLVDTVKPAKKWLNQNGAFLHAVGAPY
jgi:predicted metal-dependent hydrolase